MAIEPYFDGAVPLAPLPRMRWDELKNHYILARGQTKNDDLDAMRSRLPAVLSALPLGAAEIDLMDFLVDYEKDRVMVLEGPRGAGKSSLLHYVEAAISSTDYAFPPIFVLFDGLHLTDGHGSIAENAFAVECPRFILQELTGRLTALPKPFSTAFRRALRVLRADPSTFGVSAAFRALARGLNERQRRQVVVVFDNLDHLPIECVRAALELSRSIYTSANIGSIICLRPNCLEGVDQRGDARHFIQFRLRVPAPRADAWLGKLGARLSEQAIALSREDPREIVILGRTWTPHDLQEAMERFVRVLMERAQRPREDAVAVLQAVAADDTRHLHLLVRRMLVNGRLPTDYLMGLNDKHDYHPLTALFEGRNVLFQDDRVMPNLLYFRKGQDESDFLLSHRILSLLSNIQYASLTDLVGWLRILDYPKEVVYGCLHMLHGPLLIRGTDRDMFEPRSPPSSVYLTEAGAYYRNHLLKAVDYVSAAVLDVPLEHRAVRQMFDRDREQLRERRIPFGTRIDSMVEYAEEVAIREAHQVMLLTSVPASPGLRRVADTLRSGGLFLNDLLLVLNAALERGRYSSNTRLRQDVEQLYEPRVRALMDRLEGLQRRLEEATNRGRKIARALRSDAVIHRIGAVEVSTEDRGDDLHTRASVPLVNRGSAAILGISAHVGNMQIAQCTVAVPQVTMDADAPADARVTASGSFPVLRDQAGNKLDDVKATSTMMASNLARTVLLAPQRIGTNMQLFLVRCDGEQREHALGDPIPIERLNREAREILDSVNNGRGSRRLSRETIQIKGTKLGELVMNALGQNYLSSILPSVDHCIIFSSDDEITIPWEWLRPVPMFGEPNVMTIGERCTTARWTLNPVFAFPIGSHKIERSMERLCTVGFGVDPEHPWWQATPLTPQGLADLCQQHDVVHIVGHYNKESKEIEVRDGPNAPSLALSYDSCRAFPFCGEAHSIILSSCKIGRLERDVNVALAIAERCRSAAWTPLITITDTQAKQVDGLIATTINERNNGASLATLFRKARAHPELGALIAVYVGFGL